MNFLHLSVDIKAMKHIYYIPILLTILFASCKSAPKTTFVNTGIDTVGNIYSVCVFSEITEITAVEAAEKITAKHVIPKENYTYNPETTELKITQNPEDTYDTDDITYHIVGTAVFPAEFVLHLYDGKQGEPAVFYDDKVAVLGKDYTFDKESAHLTFLKKIDADKNSYQITWTTSDGMSSIGNKTDKYQTEYESFIQDWIETLQPHN